MSTEKNTTWVLIALSIEFVVIPCICIFLGWYIIHTYGLNPWWWLAFGSTAAAAAWMLLQQIQKRLDT